MNSYEIRQIVFTLLIWALALGIVSLMLMLLDKVVRRLQKSDPQEFGVEVGKSLRSLLIFPTRIFRFIGEFLLGLGRGVRGES